MAFLFRQLAYDEYQAKENAIFMLDFWVYLCVVVRLWSMVFDCGRSKFYFNGRNLSGFEVLYNKIISAAGSPA
jgi:hypothetical protein